jgi:prolyl-tRNA synthetase
MKLSRFYLPTLREVPAEAEVISHKLMLRAGMIRKLTAGIYSWLPLGLRSLRKVEGIIREEMNRAGALEVLLPAVQPAELWMESGRWEAYGKELLRFRDRHEREFGFGPTHEEVIVDLVRSELRSWRQLPVNLYQIQTKFRDEIRPRFGVMRGREFGMKDAYSFDADEKGAEKSYKQMFIAYTRIFARCGLKFRAVEAASGPIGGNFSHEFMVLADTGEDVLVVCSKCGYAANTEKAEVAGPQKPEAEQEMPLEKVQTPGKRTIEEVCDFLRLPPQKLVKTLIYDSDKGAVAVMVRGDRELNPNKLQSLINADWVQMSEPDVILEVTGGPLGFSGPVKLKIPIYVDQEVAAMKNFVTGANEEDCHYLNTNIGRDFKPAQVADLRVAVAGDRCAKCGAELKFIRGIEVGHIFKLGEKYSKPMKATFLDPEGKEKIFVMGCYGIGTGRTVAAAIEQNNDKSGTVWPMSIAPFQVAIVPINVNDERVRQAAEGLEAELEKMGIEVLLDDRNDSPGVKFKDVDLIGVPIRIVIGDKTLAKDSVELKLRREEQKNLIPVAEAATRVKEIIAGELARIEQEAGKSESGADAL